MAGLRLTKEIQDSLKIHKFIYHIIEPQEDEAVTYLDEIVLEASHRIFFEEMIRASLSGTRYKFLDPENQPTVKEFKKIVQDSGQFISTSKALVRQFANSHDKRMSDGVVIVALVSLTIDGSAQYFLAILKLDYTKVMEQRRDPENHTRVTLKEISDSLSEDKGVVQKRAVIDVSKTFDWDVMAVERSKAGKLIDTDSAIGRHFREFLCVTLLETDNTYTKKSISAVNAWAKSQPEVNPPDVRAKVVDYLEAKDGQVVSMDEIRDIACSNVDEQVLEDLKDSFEQHMIEKDLNGLSFTSNRKSISSDMRKEKMKTNKNVTIEWTGTRKQAGIEEEKTGDGQTLITILADKVNYES